MQNVIRRDVYLNRIISKMENGLIKVITGIRRCGKSFLLFNLFHDYLIENIIYNELLCREYSVDVGVVEIVETNAALDR